MKPVFKPLTEPSNETESAHRAAMQEKQREMRELMAAAKDKRGLTIVHTGNGKGKSTAAFGMVTRMLGHGKRCVVVQFIKSGDAATERNLRCPQLAWHRCGEGFTWDTQNRAGDIESVRTGWEIAVQAMQDPEVSLVLLDELNIALAFDYLPVDEVLGALRERQPHQHVVFTGRDAPAELIEQADLVTEMREIKHPFRAGIQAQAGIEY
ncbi:MAG TPA: cob(I)yrinic acid a,c-diamide adenosyltransferase [Opitutaceae bacterium]|jgi:cob(I)alamin adenosyltransferase|nr:cob(I)yrinic acid a,c-diamide adenosyltransferase [Opitutaceae bacterium]